MYVDVIGPMVRKGVNLPHMKVSAPFFTDKDRADLEFGSGMDVDYVALSFVRTTDDIMMLSKKAGFNPDYRKDRKVGSYRTY